MTTRAGLTALLLTSVLFVVLGAVAVYRLLLSIEAQIAAKLFHSYTEDNSMELKVEDANGAGSAIGATDIVGGVSATDMDAGNNYYASVNDHGGPSTQEDGKNEKDNEKNGGSSSSSSSGGGGGGPRVARISGFNKGVLAFLTGLLVLLAYLLLVVSDAPPVLARLGLLLCACLVLQRQVLHEVRNEGDAFDLDGGNACLGRGRYDRLASLAGSVLVVTSALNFATYASRMVAEEDVYVGPARIVGYDLGSYQVTDDAYTQTSRRTDLQVAWGNRWACPHMRRLVECRADLEGALCEMDEREENAYGHGVDDDDDAVGEEEDSRTQEVYYDSNGEKVVEKGEEYVAHAKDDPDKSSKKKKKHKGKGKDDIVEEYSVDETTRYDADGNIDSYQEDESDVEYDAKTGNLDYQESEEEDVVYTTSGDVDSSVYVLSQEDYNATDGVLLEYDYEEEEVYGVIGGGKEETSEHWDLTYEDNGKVEGWVGDLEEETYDLEMTETNAEDQVVSEFDEDYTMEEKDGKFEGAELYEYSMEAEYDEDGKKVAETVGDEFYEEGSDGSIDEEFVDQAEITYGEDGQMHEEVEAEEVFESANGETEYDKEQETVDISEDGKESYNITFEEFMYDVEGNLEKDTTTNYGGRNLRSSRNAGPVRRRRADEAEELQEAEEENKELKEENKELEEENELLKEQLEEEKEEQTEETEAADDDGDYDDDWADTDWGNVWGDYQCYNLFDADLDGGTYDAAAPAGKDDWPYLNIYGNCRTCEAFVVDRFSTDYFRGDVVAYRTAGRNDAIAAILTLGAAIALALRRRAAIRDNGGDGGGRDNKRVNFLKEEAVRTRKGGSFAQGSGPRITVD